MKVCRNHSLKMFLSTIVALTFLVALPIRSEQAFQPEKEAIELRRLEALKPTEVVEGELPNVLLIGDSISIDYTLDVRAYLTGVAYVHRPPENCQSSARGLKRMNRWLRGTVWDVIHVNFGLHDLRRDENNERLVSPEIYERNLRGLIEMMAENAKTVVWATTTPVPRGAKRRNPEDVDLYNDIALAVLEDFPGIRVADLNKLVKTQIEQLQLPRDVHFKLKGSEVLGAEVGRIIAQELPALNVKHGDH